MDPKIRFGKKVRKFRKNLGWSQEKLAFECELDRTYISSVERGERNIALQNIIKIGRGLRVHPKELLDFDI